MSFPSGHMTEYCLNELAEIINARLVGDPDAKVTGVSSFEQATPADVTFASDARFLKQLGQCGAGAVVVPLTVDPEAEAWDSGPNLLLVQDPKIEFFRLVARFHPESEPDDRIHPKTVIGPEFIAGLDPGIGPNAAIGHRVSLGDHVRIGPNVVIGNDVCIGDHVQIRPNVSIMDKTVIGDHVIIHPGAVIGSDGYGFAQPAASGSGGHEKLVHAGFVSIGDHVEIGANTTIDRGTLGQTRIGNGVKIDNQVHIAHNVQIGDNTLIVAQVGIAGSTRVENNVILAGKAGISGHITIGAYAIVGPYAGVHSDVAPGSVVSGIPQIEHSRWRKVVSAMARLPELRKKILGFDKRLNALEQGENPRE